MHGMNSCSSNRCIAPLILNLVLMAVSGQLVPWLLYPQHPLGDMKSSFCFWELNLRFSSPLASYCTNCYPVCAKWQFCFILSTRHQNSGLSDVSAIPYQYTRLFGNYTQRVRLNVLLNGVHWDGKLQYTVVDFDVRHLCLEAFTSVSWIPQ
jgi:hypothetical protein